PGSSAPDRSRTMQVAVDPDAKPEDLVQPGHVFPLRAREGGVLERAGQTESAVDLARLAGLIPAGVVCEIMAEDGTMARVPDLIPYCERHRIKLVTVADLVEYRRRHEQLVERMTTVQLPTSYGEFTAVAFRERLTGKHHVALVHGEVDGEDDVLVRVHSECLTGDVFHSLRCDCGEQLDQALSRIASEERGVLLYMAQEGRGIGLLNKLRAYELQENGLDTVEANLELGFQPDMRDYGIGNQILADLGLSTIRILTNNPKKITGIEGFGLEVVEQVPIETAPTPQNVRYLATKGDKLGHKLHHQDLKYERREAVTVMPVPGAFELPLAAMALAKTRRYACVVALGCVVRGETPHFDFIASEAASGLQLAALETGVPVAFGVLTVDVVEQAEARVSKGAEAVRTALEMADAFA